MNFQTDSNEIEGKVFELQRVILAAQQDTFAANEAQTALLKQVSALEQEIARLEAWSAEKERYALTEIGSGVYAYVVKEDAKGSEPDHRICANCYQEGHKSILQKQSKGAWRYALVCPRCDAEIWPDGGRDDNAPRPQVKGGGGSWTQTRGR